MVQEALSHAGPVPHEVAPGFGTTYAIAKVDRDGVEPFVVRAVVPDRVLTNMVEQTPAAGAFRSHGGLI